jgi:hypothetical protein
VARLYCSFFVPIKSSARCRRQGYFLDTEGNVFGVFQPDSAKVPVLDVRRAAVQDAFRSAKLPSRFDIARLVSERYPELCPRLPAVRILGHAEPFQVRMFSAAAAGSRLSRKIPWSVYNHTRIHTALKMLPALFAEKAAGIKKERNFFPSTLSEEFSP